MPLNTLPVSLTPDVIEMLERNAVAAVGISGGKDSQACLLAVHEHLNAIGHTGKRVAIHSDLGRVEWLQSLPKCEEMALHLGWELIVVKSQSGDMMDRWLVRWENNLKRYRDLSCVQLILPWSTPAMRFCTSEKKTQIIARELRKRFPGEDVINITGIRREESANRSKMPVSKPDASIVNKGGKGLVWNAIIDWKLDEVLQAISSRGLSLHEGYTRYGMSRISCVFCIMSSTPDKIASAHCDDNLDVYREMVGLEAESTFAFQANSWLADVRPEVLDEELRQKVIRAKAAAEKRVAAEKLIPIELRYEKGWPTRMPTREEAEILATVRQRVANAVGISIEFTDADSILSRYEELLHARPESSIQLIPSVTIEPPQYCFQF